jgi:hypothetical protein
MAAPRLVSALVTFSHTLNEAKNIAKDAQRWSVPRKVGGRAQITSLRRDTFVEVAFLRAFTGWEIFLEDTFLLYLIGHKAPRAPAPIRCGFPATRDAASEWCTDGKEYAKWNVADVQRRADRWLKGGAPYTPVFQGQQNNMNKMITIRNAIAHESSAARGKFETLVRNELGALPPNTTVGNFLVTTVPNTTPPVSFMESYLDKLEFAARSIVPR